jgi:hypothetical protein
MKWMLLIVTIGSVEEPTVIKMEVPQAACIEIEREWHKALAQKYNFAVPSANFFSRAAKGTFVYCYVDGYKK